MSNRQPSFIRKWLRRTVFLGIAVLAALYLLQTFVLPLVLRSQVISQLARLGYADATVAVDSVSLSSATLRDLHCPAGLDARVIHITYSPATLLSGKVTQIAIDHLFVKTSAFKPPPTSSGSAATAMPFSHLTIQNSSVELPTPGGPPTAAAVTVDALTDPANHQLNASADISLEGMRLRANLVSDLALQDMQLAARLDGALAALPAFLSMPALSLDGDLLLEAAATAHRRDSGLTWSLDRCHVQTAASRAAFQTYSARDLRAKFDFTASGNGNDLTARLLPGGTVQIGRLHTVPGVPEFPLDFRPQPAEITLKDTDWKIATAGAKLSIGDLLVDIPEGRLLRRGHRVFGHIASELDLAQVGKSDVLCALAPVLKEMQLGGRARIELARASGPATTQSATTTATSPATLPAMDQPSLSLKISNGTISSQAYQLTADGIEASIVLVDPANPHTLPSQVLRMHYGQMGKWEVRDTLFQFALKDRNTFAVEKTELGWLGGRIWTDPYTVDFNSPIIRTRVYGRELDLGKLVWIFSAEKAWAQGQIALDIPIAFLWPRMQFGAGYVEAQPGGILHLTYAANELDRYLVAADPRFATDKFYSVVRERMVNALRDFVFSRLRIEFDRKGGTLETVMQVRGKGNNSEGQEINLNLTVQDLDWLISTYLALPKQK